MSSGDGVRDILPARARRALEWLNPIMGTPSAALETSAWLDAFGPSLMPRTSQLQGVAAGLGVLAARGVGSAVDAGLRRVQPPGAGLTRHLMVRGVAGAVGAAVGALPPRVDERLTRAGLRSTGQILASAAVGGALYDTGMWVRARYPAQRAIRPVLVTALAMTGVGVRAGRQLVERRAGHGQHQAAWHCGHVALGSQRGLPRRGPAVVGYFSQQAERTDRVTPGG